MGFFKKNTEKVSDLPSLPNLPPFKESDEYQPYSFPNSNFGERLNQNKIKEAISQEEDEENDDARFENLNIKTRVIEQDYPQRITMEAPEWQNAQMNLGKRQQKIKKSEPLFIKLEKFEATVSTFNEIKQKVSEIESLLKNIRIVKNNEERELNEWEREIETLKARLDQMDQELFKGV